MSSLPGPASSGASEAPTAPRLAIIGCGNPTRSDDGVALEVIRLVRAGRARPPVGLALIDAGTSGMDVMFRVRDAARVVVVDACRSGSEPGAVFRLPAREAMTPPSHAFSLHGLRWDHALYAGSRMYGDAFVDRTEVILIEAACLDFGLELSEAARGAARKTARLLDELIDDEFAQPTSRGLPATIADGWIVLPSGTYTRAFADCTAVALLAEGERWWLLPLRSGAGGLPLKQRNADGDRVVEAREFLRAQGVDDTAASAEVELSYDDARGGFEIVRTQVPKNTRSTASSASHG